MIAGVSIALLYSSARQPYYIGYLIVFLPGFLLMIIAAAKSPGAFWKDLYYLFISSILAGSCYLGICLSALVLVFMVHGKIDVRAIVTLALCAVAFWRLRPHVIRLKRDNREKKEVEKGAGTINDSK